VTVCIDSRDAGRRLPAASTIATPYDAPVAQLDRVSASEAEGRGFESRRAHFFTQIAIRRLSAPKRSRFEPTTSNKLGFDDAAAAAIAL
jgi:hypothetical protein